MWLDCGFNNWIWITCRVVTFSSTTIPATASLLTCLLIVIVASFTEPLWRRATRRLNTNRLLAFSWTAIRATFCFTTAITITVTLFGTAKSMVPTEYIVGCGWTLTLFDNRWDWNYLIWLDCFVLKTQRRWMGVTIGFDAIELSGILNRM